MQSIPNINSYCFALLIAAGLFSAPVTATENITAPVDPGQPAGVDAEAPLQQYEYQLEGRSDPFVPFISAKVATRKIGSDDIIDEDVELTGMRQFEPGQLTLVAVLQSGSNNIAMVEDVTGRGYILNKGMPIGRRGIVTNINIEAEQVTVTETAHTRAGRKLENEIVMRLNKEGDK